LNDGVEIAHDGVLTAIRDCVVVSDGVMWIVSKAGPRTEARTRDWLRKVEFFDRTGMSPANLRFCPSRPDKAPSCCDIGITHFIDDKINVMQILHGIVPHLFLFSGGNLATHCPRGRRPSPDGVILSTSPGSVRREIDDERRRSEDLLPRRLS
jgi:hypothetical protein